MNAWPAAIRATCAAHFGRYDAKRHLQVVPNRCDACPIGVPCRAHGGRPARTLEELAESRALLEAEAGKVLGGGA